VEGITMAKNPYINIYAGDPTEGEKDGFAISSDGSFSAPLSVLFDVMNADDEERSGASSWEYFSVYKYVKLAVRLEEGFEVDGGVSISVPWGNWEFTTTSPSLGAAWSRSISFPDSRISDVNRIFYARLGTIRKAPAPPSDYLTGRDSLLTLSAKIFPA
jgi:hypothetical protein